MAVVPEFELLDNSYKLELKVSETKPESPQADHDQPVVRSARELKIENELAISIAWWNSRDEESRTKMLESIDHAIVGKAWECFGVGSYLHGWRPTQEQLNEAYEIIKNSVCIACDQNATGFDGLCESCREAAGYYV